MENNLTIIENIVRGNGIELEQSQVEKLGRYFELLIEYNQKFNLTSITEVHEVALKHFADSMVEAGNYKADATVLDVGSGAGFPGIPLAIARPDLKITLVDSLNKRIEFLKVVIEELGLKNVVPEHSRAQEFCTDERREKFDYCIARAVAPMNILLELCVPFVKVDGYFVGYKSVNLDVELTEAKNAMGILGVKLENVKDVVLSSETVNNGEILQRKIAYLKKIKSTPKKYPRAKNLIKTKPIV